MAAQQRESSPDRLSTLPTGTGGNKLVILLLVGGVAVLGIAALLLWKLGGSDEKPPAPPVVEEQFEAPTPLVTEPPRPILDRAPDAGSLVVVPDEDDGKKTPRGGGERLGTIDTAAVNTYVKAHFAEVRTCYERRLKMNPGLEGDLDLNISISSAGKVTGIGVNSDTVRDPEMLECVRRTIRGWSFPKPTGGRAVVAKNFKFKKKV